MKKYLLSVGFVLVSMLAIAQSGKLVAEKSGKGAVIIHEVQPKEGLYSLSRIYGVKVSEIAAANGFDVNKSLAIGQKVKIPLTANNLSQKKGKTPVYYTISDGENLTSISNRFNKVPIKELKSWNKLGSDVAPKGKEIIVGYFTGNVPAGGKQQSDTETAKSSKSNPTQVAVITGTNINIRKGPSTDQPVVGTAQKDDRVTVLKRVNDEWTSIRTGDGVEGYIASQFLQLENDKETAKTTVQKTAAIKTAKIVGSSVNVRKGPARDQEVLTVANEGESVEILKEIDKDWTWIRTKDGVEGFMASQFLKPEAAPKGAIAKTETKKSAPVKTGKVYGTNVNIRKGPSTSQEVVAIAQENDEIEILKEVNKEWTSIRTKDGIEGYIASQFLKPRETQPEPQKVEQKAKAYATNINVRKGPSTSQDVIGLVRADEEVVYVRKVDDEWSEIRMTDGTHGFVATRFLSFDGQPSAAAIEAEELAKAQEAQERALAAAQTKEEVKESVQEVAASASRVVDETGYFKEDFEKYKNPNLISEQLVASGIFKTDRGWSDGKYYLLMDNAAPGTVVKLINPENNKFVYAKVLGKMKGVQYSEGYDIRISEAAASKLGTGNMDKFNVRVAY